MFLELLCCKNRHCVRLYLCDWRPANPNHQPQAAPLVHVGRDIDDPGSRI